ncbi:DUF2530 domain-containing protein [Mycobacterium sp. 663a-19]|uniref:DUF2530 domain-containing protein n=1 Tax=Mycobacterium sp. 663a-19 TaxID=2986148 RepID=UPI002D1F2ECF|nr:DUF2530 domain-containing protein [Mycobacterium sp. 663a-19]MEB3979985.1 DUF2530 domain-containing protein [Mycobacterium sp. 663a-19]
MSVGPGESEPGSSGSGESAAGDSPEAPPLPPVLLEVWPVVVIGFLGWLAAAAAAFLVPALQGWRPVTLAGLGTGLLGTSIFVWQLTAVRRGARGAQSGLENYLNHN